MLSRPGARALAMLAVLSVPAGPAAQEGRAPVAVAEAESRPILREERLTGTVTSPRTAALSVQVGGMVTRLPVDAGDRVAQGDVVVRLDDELAAHRLAGAAGAARRARAELAEARRRRAEGEALVRDQSIPESELEAREAAVEVAAGDAAAASAEEGRRRALVARHRVTAPFDGVVSRRVTELGEWVSPGSTVVELVATDGLRFDFRAPQALYPSLSQDPRITVYLDALPGARFPGTIRAAVPVSDPSSRTFLLRVVPAGDAHPAMTPGMSAHAILQLDTGRDGVVVPRDALLRHPDGRISVWELDRSGEPPRVRERRVRLGVSFGGRVEIRQGLQAGATVVVEGNEALQEGQAVRVRGGD